MQNKISGKMKKLLSVFFVFLRIGAFTFGGGYAMIPLIEKETVEKKKWIKSDDILDIIAIAESTPGPIAINSATFVGYKVCGFLGSFFATLGIVIPSFVIILLIAYLLGEFAHIKMVQYAFFGIRAGVLALIFKALFTMYKKCPKNKIAYVIMILSFCASVFLNVNVLYIIIGCAVIGLVSSLVKAGRVEK